MSKYIIQKATEFDKQSAAFKKAHTLKGLASTHLLQAKYDGCHMIVRVGTDGVVECLSRTGELVQSCDHIGAAVKRVFDSGWVVFGEVWRKDTSFPDISGMYRRHNPEPSLKFVPYDIVPSGSYAIGIHDVPYKTRMQHLYQRLRFGRFDGDPFVECEYYPPGTYADPTNIAQTRVAMGGFDGAILRDLEAYWSISESKNGELIKVKPNMSLDLKVTGVDVDTGEKTGRNVYTIEVVYQGIKTKVGSGIPHDFNKVPIVGDIVEVVCMGMTEEGKLREPRFKGIRHDKLKPD